MKKPSKRLLKALASAAKDARKRLSQQRRVTPQPDRDMEALKACCKAIESCSCKEMIQATLDFLNSKYGPPGAV